MTSKLFLSIPCVLLLSWATTSPALSADADKASASAKAEAADAELEQLQASAKAFEKAFNEGDAKALGALFIEQAEVVDADGTLVKGREAIETRFAALFKETPGSKIEVAITSLRQLTPAVALEEGQTKVTLPGEQGTSVNSYTLIHLKQQDGKWRFASVRDFPEETPDTPHEHLKSLEWIVGHWVDESDDGRVYTSYKWSDDGNYLLSGYAVKSKLGGELKGSQRIGWDPLRRTIRGWVFDESGGIMESEWTPAAGGWIVKSHGNTADGQSVSTTRIITPLSNDIYQIDSTQRIVGGEILPDTSVRVVRQPPAPQSK